jgi:cytochrome c551/c552
MNMEFLDSLASTADVIQKLFAPPTEGRSTLLQWMLNLTLLLNLPFAGLLVTGTTLSLVLNLWNQQDGGKNNARLAKDVIDMVTVNRGAGFILGVFPIVALITIYGQIVYTYHLFSYTVWLAALFLATLGIVHIYFYKEQWAMRERSWGAHFLTGLFGVALLMGAYLLIFSNVVIAAVPERWPLVDDFTDVVFTWDIVWRFLQWGALSWSILGAAILFFFFRWEDRASAMDAPYAEFARRTGVGLMLAFILQAPVTIFLELYNNSNVYFPMGSVYVVPPAMFDAAIVALLLCMAVGHLAYLMIVRRNAQFGTHAFVLVLGVFTAWIIGGQFRMADALQEHTMSMHDLAMADIDVQREKLAGPVETDPEKRIAEGGRVFQATCTSCHSADFKTKGLGPALAERLPKYRGDKDKLMQWIVTGGSTGEPGWPPMPPQSVRPRNLPMLAEYLLNRLEKGE